MASIHHDKALQWHMAYEKTRIGYESDWTQYVEAIKDRNGPSYETPIGDLMRLRQKGSLAEFNDAFHMISCKLWLSQEYPSRCLH